VGKNVKGVKKGERFVAITGRGCGECYWCRQGEWIRCSKMQLLGYGMDGGFAEYVSVPNFSPGKYAERLPEAIPYEIGATAEPLSVGLYAVNKTAPKPGDDVVVIGAGVIGLSVIQVLRAKGIKSIIVSGRRAARLALAKVCGATKVVDASVENILPVVEQLTHGKGADVVFECAGNAGSFEQAQRMTHRGGKIGVVGLYEQPVTWNPVNIVTNDIDFIGIGLRFDLPGAIALMKAGKVDTRPLITHQFPLSQVKQAFETQATSPDAVKVLVLP
jgi:threonine dehydrogenase-like Zn-dependent dehydrogenase